MSSLSPSSYEFDAHGRQASFGTMLALGVLTAAVTSHLRVADAKQHDSTEAIFEAGQESDINTLLIPLFGCNANHFASADAYESALGHHGTVLHTQLPRVGSSTDNLKRRLIQERWQRPESKIVFHGHSYGAEVAMNLLDDPVFTGDFGKPDVLILEAPALGKKSVTRRGRLALDFAAVAQQFARGDNNRLLNRFVAEPAYGIAAKRRAIYDTTFEDGCLEGSVSEVYLIQPKSDPFVVCEEAREKVREAFGSQHIEVIIDDKFRPACTHTSSIHHPQAADDILSKSPALAHSISVLTN